LQCWGDSVASGVRALPPIVNINIIDSFIDFFNPRGWEGPLASVIIFCVGKSKALIKTHRTIILPVVLYGCETWSLTLREKRRLRVLENYVPRRIFGVRRDEVKGEWRKLHNEGLNHLYCSPNIFRVIKRRRMRLVGHVARMGEENRCVEDFGGET